MSLFGRITAIFHAPMLLPIVTSAALGAIAYRTATSARQSMQTQPQQQQSQEAVSVTAPPQQQSGQVVSAEPSPQNPVHMVNREDQVDGSVSTPGTTRMTIQPVNISERYPATVAQPVSAGNNSGTVNRVQVGVQAQSTRDSSGSSGGGGAQTVR